VLTSAFIAATVVLGVAGQLLLKLGMNHAGRLGQIGQLFSARYLAGAASTWQIWAGLFMYFLGALLWMVVLSREDLTFAYPFLGLTYILILLCGHWILGEPAQWWRVAGTIVVAIGVLLIAKS
jgi:drug/metabolite transporter (DMT)-like permease